jgi:hypothetical protein
MSSALRQEAEKLRLEGYLYSEITDEIGVAKSTVYGWTHDIEMSDNAKKIVARKIYSSKLLQINKLAKIKSDYVKQKDLLIQNKAKEVVKGIELNNKHQMIICAVLFWCEGGKDVRGGIQFINSDPIMIRLFLKLLREAFGVEEEKFRALVHLHDYHDKDTTLKYWSDITRIPLSRFYKPYRKPNTGKNYHEGYRGCVSIRYSDSQLGKFLKMLYIEFSKEF